MQAPDDSTRIGATIAAQTRELHLGQHLGSRFWHVVSPLGAANTPSRRALAVACGSLDLASSRWIGPPRRHLGAQVVIDLADQALWSTLANDEPESSRCAFIPGASLAAELAARWRWRAAALPLAHLAVAGLVRRRAATGCGSGRWAGNSGGWSARWVWPNSVVGVERGHSNATCASCDRPSCRRRSRV